jgi:hypothetical protein
LYERLYFYLGTYVSKTYIFPDRPNVLVHYLTESIGKPGTDWYVPGLLFEEDVALAPSGEKTADKLSFATTQPGGKGDVIMWVPLKSDTTYTFSVWLWSPFPKTINLAMKTREGDALVALQQVTLGPDPVRYSLTGKTFETALYDVDIGRTPYPDATITLGTEPGDFFYAWGAQLEEGAYARDFDSSGKLVPDSVRVWRPGLLLLNFLMMLLVGLSIFRGRNFWLRERTGLLVLTIIFGSMAQSLVIIPEQRFAIGWLVFLWLMAGSYIGMAGQQMKKQKLPVSL